MGTRSGTVLSALRSNRAESIFGAILVVFFSVVTVWVVVSAYGDLTGTAEWPAMVASVAISIVIGAVLAVLVPRIRTRWMRDLRSRLRGMHWGVLAFWIPFGVMMPLGAAPAFAESYVCERGDGILVSTSWTDTDPEGVKSGEYTYDGKTYAIRISGEFWLSRQAAPPQPPTEDNPYYTRTYRVPWAGSGKVCGNTDSSDLGDRIAIGLVGGMSAAAAIAAARELLRRRRSR